MEDTMQDFLTAIAALQVAADALNARLVAYDAGTYDEQIRNGTAAIVEVTARTDALAPTPPGRALELTAVEQ